MKLIIKTNSGSIKLGNSFLIASMLLVLAGGIVAVLASGESASGTTTMNATVSQVISITKSAGLTRGILFCESGGLYSSCSAGINNYLASNDTTRTGNVTDYNITVDSSTTSNVAFWHKANDMTLGSDTTHTILIPNVTDCANTTYNGYNVNMTTNGASTNSVTMATTYKVIGETNTCNNVPAGGNCYIAYWIDLPVVAQGTYNTTYNYCANSTVGTTSC